MVLWPDDGVVVKVHVVIVLVVVFVVTFVVFC